MISEQSYTKEWIDALSRKLEYNDKALIEKVIRALSLLEHLVQMGCPLVFRGGTSLMLILGESLHRASIDIDIICPPGTDIEKYLVEMERHGFANEKPISIAHSMRDLPATHTKVYYEISYSSSSKLKEYIKLDVLYDECPYSKVLQTPIASPFLATYGEPVMVNVATKEEMLGDKMTAFAPNTIGIPYYNGQRDCFVEIIKQLYDISRLFENVEDYSAAYKAFLKVSAAEMKYRGLSGQLDKYYEDVRQTALCIATRGQVGNGIFSHLQNGILRIKPFMYQQKYYIEDAILDSSRAAYLATCFEKGITAVERYSGNPADVAEIKLSDSVTNKLNKLKTIVPEAYYYWVKTSALL